MGATQSVNMSIVQVQGGGGRVASDRTSFVGARVPPEIKAMIKPLNKLDKNTFRKVLKCNTIISFSLFLHKVKSYLRKRYTPVASLRFSVRDDPRNG